MQNKRHFIILIVAMALFTGVRAYRMFGIGHNSQLDKLDSAQIQQERQNASAGMTEFKYFCADGGPHIVIPESLLKSWTGASNLVDILDPKTDYGRACAVSQPMGMLTVADGQALVLAGSPPMSAWRPLPDGRGVDVFVLESWNDQNLDALIKRAIAATPDEKMTDTGVSWKIDADNLMLMFAGESGAGNSSAYGILPMKITRGTYSIFKMQYDEAKGSVSIFRIRSNSK